MDFPPEHFLYAVDDGLAKITIARPEKLNAFTRAMGASFMTLLDRVDSDDDVRVLLITGMGRAFCAGADLTASDSSFAANMSARNVMTGSQPSGESRDAARESPRDLGGLITLRLFECLKPVIVAFNGPAAGMGITMSLAADIRLASTGCKFSLPFVRRGIVPESASAWFLPRIVGIAQALEWTLTGRTFSASEALAGGLVRSLHEPPDLLGAATSLAREIADNTAPVSVALTRQLLWRMMSAEHPMDAHRIESFSIQSRIKSTDVREGVASFMEKRQPHFKDKVSTSMPDFFPWWDEQEF